MPRKKGRFLKKDAQAISQRLRQFARRFDSQSAFAVRFKIPRTTLRSWTHHDDPAVPDSAYLIAMARDGGLSLNWLLLGEGPELRVRETQSPRGAVLAALAAELRATEVMDEDDHEQAWARLVTYTTKKDGFNAVLKLAVEAVRPLYELAVREIQEAQAVAHNLMQMYRTYLMTEPGARLPDAEMRERLLKFRADAVAAQLAVRRSIVVYPGGVDRSQESGDEATGPAKTP